jgi:acyl transferase domain-containing protein/acyl carrier protein
MTGARKDAKPQCHAKECKQEDKHIMDHIEELPSEVALAIIGMAGRFPGANNVAEFWQNIVNGVNSIQFFSDEELLARGVNPEVLADPNYVKAGTELDDVALFDARFFGYSPREAEVMDPQSRLFLQCAWHALENAGYDPLSYDGLIGIFGGKRFPWYLWHNASIIVPQVGIVQSGLSNHQDSFVPTVAYKLNLRGPSVNVQTFCSTSLVSVHMACQSLLAYECDMALAGGAAIQFPHGVGYVYQNGGIASPDGYCRAFDAAGQGSVFGDGLGLVVIKRLDDALADGDHIYSIIRGTATNNDGMMRVGYTAPGLNGQTAVIAEAIANAGIPAETIRYIEAHGTGTPLGDSIELEATMRALHKTTNKTHFCAIGSLKPNVGHLDRAAGVAGIIKASLALENRVLPPNLNFHTPNPDFDWENSPFYVQTELAPWDLDNSCPRRAGVSSFGLGGMNAHVILEEAPERVPSDNTARSNHLILVSAKTDTALDTATFNLAQHLRENPTLNLADVAYTLQVGRHAFEHRRMVVGESVADVLLALESLNPQRVLTNQQPDVNRSVVFMFPGVGDHYEQMARDLYEQELTFRQTVDDCCDILLPLLGVDLRMLLYPEVSSHVNTTVANSVNLRQMLERVPQQTSDSPLDQTEFAQPAVFVIEYALAQQLQAWGIIPDALIGYSLGEYTAACVAGALDLEDALTLVTKRAQLIQTLPQGHLVTVPLSEEDVQIFLNEQISLAIVNGPANCVLAGNPEAIAQLETTLTEQQIAYRRLDIGHAFHSTMMTPIAAEFTNLVRQIEVKAPQIPYLSNVTGMWITTDEVTDPEYWARHLCQTVRFGDSLRELLKDADNSLLVEIGPGQSLCSFAKQHPDTHREHFAHIVPTMRHVYDYRSDTATLLEALGKLWLVGLQVEWPKLYTGDFRHRLPLPNYPFEGERYWIDGMSIVDVPAVGAATPIKRKEDIADWFFEPIWEEAPLITTNNSTNDPCLIFIDDLGWGEHLSQQLRQLGRQVVSVRAGKAYAQTAQDSFIIRPDVLVDYQTLIATLQQQDFLPGQIVHMWSVSGSRSSELTGVEGFQEAQHLGFYSLLHLAQTLAEDVGQSLQLLVISNDMQPVGFENMLYPEKATVLGPCRVIPQENQHIRCRSIDITLTDSVNEEIIISQLMAELNAPINDVTVAYRESTRYLQAFNPKKLTAEPTLRPKGVYLITGGLGGIGPVLAEYLIQQTQARIVLTSRSGLPPRETWDNWLARRSDNDPTKAKIKKVLALEALGTEVLVIAADVGSITQMRAAVDQIYQQFGTLNGVIHSAGLTSIEAFKVIQNMDRTTCEAHFQPKAKGLYVLEEVLQDKSIDFCALFSSMSSILGGLGFIAYTAANAFMDVYAHAHNRNNDSKWIVVNWDTWRVGVHEEGLLDNATVAVFEMTQDEGVQAFARTLASDTTQLVNSTGDLQARIRQWLWLEGITRKKKGKKYARPTLLTAYSPVRNDYEKQIALVWQDVLGIEQIGIHDNFFDLGGNSLIGLDVITQLQKIFDKPLSPIILFEAPTISSLASHLQPELTAETDTAKTILVERRRHARQHVNNEGVAVIGMTGRFPGAKNVEEFWENLCGGVETITRFTDEELLAAGVEAALLKQPNYIKAKPIIEDVDMFDAALFGYSPREAELMDPQHRIFLECAWEVIEIAGYNMQTYKGLVGVFAGTNLSTYMLGWYRDPELVEEISGYQLGISSDKDSLTTTVSYKLNLRGPSLAVQTFCSTSLVAIHLASQSLLNGECDMALAGGTSIVFPQKQGYKYEEGGMESPDGHCRTFDAQAKGTLFADGVGVVVLKRLEDALEDGDTIYGVLKGSAVNNDGSLKVGFTAPSVAGQAEAVTMALERAGIDPETVTYVEAHGTATELGDPIEVASLTRAYRQFTDKKQFCALGSVKSNFGHADRASGVIGFIKAILAVQHGVIPPSLHYQSPNPEIDFDNSPFFVNVALSPWPVRNGIPRRAGINSLGMGGTNAHVIVEEPPTPRLSDPSRPWQLLLLSARTESALDAATANLAQYLRENPDVNLADVAYTLQVGRRTFATRRMVVCQDVPEALTALESLDPKRVFTHYQPDATRSLVFMFPGIGDHYLHMAKDLYEEEPIFQGIVEQCCRFLYPQLGVKLADLLYPPDEMGTNVNGSTVDLRAMLGRKEQSASASVRRLQETAVAQPLIFVVEYALANLLLSWGIRPQALVGYSLGEYVAACIAGVLSLEDALRIVAGRAKMIQTLPSGSMLAVSLSLKDIQPLLSTDISLATHNGQTMCVLAGAPEAIIQLETELSEKGISCRQVQTTHAFHSHMMEPLRQDMITLAQSLTLNPPRIPYISNVTGTWITDEQAMDVAYWAQHMCEPVRFFDALNELLEDKEQILLEVGPGQGLSSFAKQHPACERVQMGLILPTVRSPYDHQTDRAFLLNSLGKLWMLGVDLDWVKIYQNEKRHRIPVPTYPFERQQYWLESRPASVGVAHKRKAKSVEAALTAMPRQEIANWFYLPGWKQASPHQALIKEEGLCWLLFIDACGVGARVTEWLTVQEQSVVTVEVGPSFAQLDKNHYSVNPNQRSDYDLLLRTLQAQDLTPSNIVHLWQVTSESAHVNSDETLNESLDLGFYSLMFFIQSLGELGLANCDLSIVTTHVHAVTDHETIYPEKATIMGPCRLIPVEYPDVTCRLIDIEWNEPDSRDKDRLIANLLGELTAIDTERIIALRGYRRWLQTFEPIHLSPLESGETPQLRPNGVYLVTGGLGGVGLALAEYLAETVQARLVLTGRTPLPPRSEWPQILSDKGNDGGDGRKIAWIQKLEALGAKVLPLVADVTNKTQMDAVVQQTLVQFGALHGVIHAAGVPGVGLTQLKTKAIAHEVLAPKVMGTRILEQVLKDTPLDFLVLCSSITSSTGGGPGQIDYCAANAFLDAYAQSRLTTHQFITSVNWGEWQWNAWDAGLGGFDDAVQNFFRENRKQFGIDFSGGKDAFARILANRWPHIIVSTQDFPGMVEISQRFTIKDIINWGRTSDDIRQKYPRPVLGTSFAAPRNDLERKIADIWSDVLGISEIGINDNFFDLGGNSLIGLDIIVGLRKELNVEAIPAYILYEAPSISAMAQFVNKEQDQKDLIAASQERSSKRREGFSQRKRQSARRK